MKALLRIAVVWNVAVACNRATADYLISSPLFVNRYEAAVPTFEDHARRPLPGPDAIRTAPSQPIDGVPLGGPGGSSGKAPSGQLER